MTETTIQTTFVENPYEARKQAKIERYRELADRKRGEAAATLERAAADETAEQQVGEVRVVDSVEDNRLQAFFPGKPSDEVRAALKRAGFRWSPSNGCWQSYRGERYSVALRGILQGAQ